MKYKFINVFALNEFDKNNYLNKESNLGATILKKELKNNYLKLVKWGILSYLGGVKTIKIAFVTRENIDNNEKHLISEVLVGEFSMKLLGLLKTIKKMEISFL